MTYFIDKLNQIMETKGYTQQALARMGHVSNNTISKWLNGQTTPKVKNLEPLAKALGLTIGDLTGDFGLSGHDGYRVGLQPGIAWMPTKHWTAAFRFAFIGYNKCGFYGEDGFNMTFATSAPAFGLYYNF